MMPLGKGQTSLAVESPVIPHEALLKEVEICVV
jgi:hypothetical protein